MSTRTITIDHGDTHITITGPSAQFFGGDLYTQAIVALIHEADTSGWDKHQTERGAPMGAAADQFYAAILGAVARHANVSFAGMVPEGTTVAELLRQMMRDLVTKGRLTTILTSGGERDPDDA